MSRKFDMKAAMSKAASAQTPKELDPFERTAELLKHRPTGYTVVQPIPEKETKEQQVPVAEGRVVEEKSTPLQIDAVPGNPPAEMISSATIETPPITAIVSTSVASKLKGEPRYEIVPLHLIDENPFNARHIYLPEKVSELSDSMTKNGQLIPGLATSRGERRTLIAGHYRKKAATLAGIPALRLMVYDNVSDQDLYLYSYLENTKQSEQTTLDNALAWRLLLDKGVFESEVAIAESVGMSKSNINKTLAVLKLESSVMAYVEQNPSSYGMSVLYELVLLQQSAGSGVAGEMAARVIETGAGRKEIIQARLRHEASNTSLGRPRQREAARSYKLWNNGVNIGNVKEWDSGKVMFELTFSDQLKKQQFIDEMRARIQETPGIAPSADIQEKSEE